MNETANKQALVALKAAHTAIWATVEAAVLYLLWSGITRRSDRRAAVAAAVVVAESATFLANGARCPLTLLAERLGAERGSVTDVFLPRWFAHNLPAIHVPMLGAIVWLHARNLSAAGATGPGSGGRPRCR